MTRVLGKPGGKQELELEISRELGIGRPCVTIAIYQSRVPRKYLRARVPETSQPV